MGQLANAVPIALPLPTLHLPIHAPQTCLDINECLSISQLDPKCTCERCACKNTYGGYE